jgi:hypothetical protein
MNILPDVIDFGLIKVATRATAITTPKRRVAPRQRSIHKHRWSVTIGRLL